MGETDNRLAHRSLCLVKSTAGIGSLADTRSLSLLYSMQLLPPPIYLFYYLSIIRGTEKKEGRREGSWNPMSVLWMYVVLLFFFRLCDLARPDSSSWRETRRLPRTYSMQNMLTPSPLLVSLTINPLINNAEYRLKTSREHSKREPVWLFSSSFYRHLSTSLSCSWIHSLHVIIIHHPFFSLWTMENGNIP